MANIMLHQPMTLVLMKDGTSYRTLMPVKEFHENANKHKFIFINGESINTTSIKKAIPKTADEIEYFVLSQDRLVQEAIQERQRVMKDLNKSFKNVASIIKRLESHGIEYNHV